MNIRILRGKLFEEMEKNFKIIFNKILTFIFGFILYSVFPNVIEVFGIIIRISAYTQPIKAKPCKEIPS